MAMKRRTRNLLFRVYLPLALLVGLIGALIWGRNERRDALRYRNRIEEQHAQAFHDLSTDLARMETALSKLVVSASKEQAVLLLAELWRSAGASSQYLMQIPAGYEAYSELNTFVAQIGDYAHTLLTDLAKGGALERQDIDQIATLYETAAALSRELQQARADGETAYSLEALDSGFFWATEKSNALIGVEALEEGSDRYPHLIYDGPFSESATRAEPIGLGAQLYDPSAAFEVARIFLADVVDGEIVGAGEQNGRIEAYLFRGESMDSRTVEIAVTKRGGQPLWMRMYERDTADNAIVAVNAAASENTPTPTEVSVEDLAAIGQAYLREKGFDAMEPRHWQRYDGAIVINYVYVQNGVLVYNDQIKLWIEVDTGRIIGFDAEDFLFSHTQRDIPSAALTVEQAQRKLAAHLTVLEAKRALIPISADEERFCYEFRVAYNDDTYLVYVNAVNGREEEILRFIDTATGELLL